MLVVQGAALVEEPVADATALKSSGRCGPAGRRAPPASVGRTSHGGRSDDPSKDAPPPPPPPPTPPSPQGLTIVPAVSLEQLQGMRRGGRGGCEWV